MRSIFGIVGLVFVLCGFASGQASNCPKIRIDGPSGNWTRPGSEIIFTVSVEGDDISGLKYKWFVSDGTISNGQNTEAISIDTTGLNNQTLTVTVEVTGLPVVCVDYSSASHSISDGGHLDPIDEFEGLSTRAENIRFDSLGQRMKDEPTIFAYILRYYPKRTTKLAIGADQKRIHSFLKTRWAVKAERVMVVSAGLGGKRRTKVYLVPSDSPILPKN